MYNLYIVSQKADIWACRKEGRICRANTGIFRLYVTLYCIPHPPSLHKRASTAPAEAKLSKGTLYYYYSTKDELIVTITDDCLCHMTDILFSWVDGLNREEALRPALIRLFESLMADEHNARLYCVLCAECASEDTPIREFMTEYKQKWRLMLELGALKLQSRNAGILGERAELFFTLLSGHMLQTFGGMGSISIETLVDALMRE